MTIKIVLSILIIISGSLVGAKLSERVKEKKEIFSSLLAFNNEFMSEVSLYRKSVLYKLEHAPDILNKTFLGSVDALKNGNEFVSTDNRLTAEERQFISNYINGLGKTDESGQIIMLKMYNEKIKSLLTSAENNYQKSAKLFTKLGFSLALTVVIIMF